MVKVHTTRSVKGSILALCFLTSWICNERKTVDTLIRILVSAVSLLVAETKIAMSLMWKSFNRSTQRHNITNNLKPGHFVCQGAIDAYLNVLCYHRNIFVRCEFAYHLLRKTTHEMTNRPLFQSGHEQDANLIMVALFHSRTHHSALTVVRRFHREIDIFDTRIYKRSCTTIYPLLIQ